jgi:PHD-finger
VGIGAQGWYPLTFFLLIGLIFYSIFAPATRYWDTSSDSVQCDGCKSHFHMACVQPPLVAKPARGYGWSCARCAHKDDDDEGTHLTPPATSSAKPKSGIGATPRPRGRPKGSRNNTSSPVKHHEETEDKYYKMWPFRYFGYV